MTEKAKACFIISIVLYAVGAVLAVLSFLIKGYAALALSIPALVIVIGGAFVQYFGSKTKIEPPKEEQLSFDFDIEEVSTKEAEKQEK